MDDMLADLYEDPQGDKEEQDYPSCPFLSEHAPRIHDFVRFDRYKGKPRKTGSLSISVEGTLFVLRINDRDLERSFSATGHNLQECLQFADQCVATRQLHWRYWGNPTDNGKRKKDRSKK